MQRQLLRIIATLAALSALLGRGTLAQIPDRITRYAPPLQRVLEPPTRHDIWVRVGDDSLEATYYVPGTPPPDTAGYPAMLFVHGFGESKESDTLDALYYAQSGYVGFCYSVRGQGNSGGGATILGPAERHDLAVVLDTLRAIPAINGKKIGIQGGSQGGLHVLWAVADTLSVAAGLADVITPCWATDMFLGGSVRTTLALLLRTDGVRYAPVRDTLWGLLREDRFAQLREKFAAGRDVDTAQLHASGIPLATFVKWQAHYFSAADGMASYLGQPWPRKICAGTGGHYSDDPITELEYQWSIIGDWFGQFVLGYETGILSRPPVTLAFSALPVQSDGYFSWSRMELERWPIPWTRPVRLYLNPDSTLSSALPVPPGIRIIRNDWNENYPLDSGFVDGFHGTRFQRNLPREVETFTSSPLASDLFWIGTPRARLHLGSYYEKFPLHVQISEVEPDGTRRLVNRIPFTARNWTPGDQRPVEMEGLMHAHKFTRGSRIRIDISNIDAESKFLWGNVPFSLPMFAVASAALFIDSVRSSYIELPSLGAPGLPNVVENLVATIDGGLRRVLVTWETGTELLNAGFVVERSDSPGGVFAPRGFVPGAGGPDPARYQLLDTLPPLGRWYYRVRQFDQGGITHLSGSVGVDVPVTVAGEQLPGTFGLMQNYPNPFNPSTTIPFSLPAGAFVSLKVSDLLGREVATLANERWPAGRHEVTFDGAGLPSGFYVCRMAAGEFVTARKILLMI
jgi:predicted acyl esterase